MRRVLVLPGDGQGPALADIACRIISEATDQVEFVESPIGRSGYELTGLNLPHETMDLADEFDTIICGPVQLDEKDRGTSRDPLHTLKTQLDLFATIRNYVGLSPDLGCPDMRVSLWCCNSVPGRDIVEESHLEGVDLIKYVRNSSYRRMMERASSEAATRDSKKVACVVNDEMFPESSRMFREVFEEFFTPDRFDTTVVDADCWASWVIRRPDLFDTVVCVDLYGPMAGGILSGLMGGSRLSPYVYAGDETSLIELIHGNDHATVDPSRLNPTSAILGACMTLLDLDMPEECERIYRALRDCYGDGERTPDVGGSMTTSEFVDAVVSRI